MKTIELSISDKNKSLLTHLQENGEFLPAYCACRGTCGKCKVQFLIIYQPILHMTLPFFQQKNSLKAGGWHVRLI